MDPADTADGTGTDLVDDPVAKYLEHYGIKGMRWGVRKSEDSGGGSSAPKERGAVRRGATKANAALDAGKKVIDEGEKKLIFLPQEHRNKAASNTQARVLGVARSVNKSPQFNGKDLKGNTRLRNAYMKKVEDAAKDIYAEELGISRAEAWGDFLGVKVDTTSMRISAARNRIKHTEEDDRETLLVMNFDLDDLGHIVNVTVPDEFVKHTGDDLELIHYGIKGMRWGVRKSEHEGGTTAKRAPVPSADKARAAENAAKVTKKGDTSALSNAELQQLVQRMNLEQQYSRLSSQPGRMQAGSKKTKEILDTVETGKRVYNLAPTPVKTKIAKALGKGALKVGVSAAVLAGKAYYKSRG